MSGGVTDGQAVNAAVTDAAFLHKNAAEQMPAQLDFTGTQPSSGASVVDIQKNVNALWSFLGGVLNSVYNILPTWATNNRGSSTDTVFQRVGAIDTAFNPSTGHGHTGASGDAPKIVITTSASSGAATSGQVATADGSGNIAWLFATPQQTSFTIANNQSSPTNVTGLLFNGSLVRSFNISYQVYRNTTGGGATELAESGMLLGVYYTVGATWDMTVFGVDAGTSGVTFSITSSGQIQYTSTNITGTAASSNMKYTYSTIGV